MRSTPACRRSAENLGQARAGAGRMAKFLGLVSPALLTQVKAAKNNAAAFDLIAGAMAKVKDPAERAALAQMTVGDAALGALLAKGSKGHQGDARDHYLALAGSQEGRGEVGRRGPRRSMLDLKATTDGVKAAIVEGLSPALKVIVDQLTEWFAGHREDVKEWAAQIGEKLAGRGARASHRRDQRCDRRYRSPFFDSVDEDQNDRARSRSGAVHGRPAALRDRHVRRHAP